MLLGLKLRNRMWQDRKETTAWDVYSFVSSQGPPSINVNVAQYQSKKAWLTALKHVAPRTFSR